MLTAGEKRLAATLGPLDTVIAKKFIKTLSVVEAPSWGTAPSTMGITMSGAPPNGIFKTGTELMYGGQGKITNTTNLTTVTETQNERDDVTDTGTGATEPCGLAPPRLIDTNEEATGDDRKKIRQQNKQRRQRLKATQQPQSLWTDHTGTVPYESTPMPRERGEYRNSMCPTGRALRHPATDNLREWATLGCPTRTGRNWSKDEIWEAVERGPHRSATLPEAIKHFAAEIKEKIRTKQARVVAWDDLKDDPPPQLKVSPIAAILHKSKAFRSILDLSFRLRLKNGGVLAAVNDTTIKTAEPWPFPYPGRENVGD